MQNNIFFSATMQKSPASLPAQIMTEHSLDRVVYFVLRGGTDEQREALANMLRMTLITRIPLRKARREMWICRCQEGITTMSHLDNYQAVLQHVFGDSCRIRVRVLWKEGEA